MNYGLSADRMPKYRKSRPSLHTSISRPPKHRFNHHTHKQHCSFHYIKTRVPSLLLNVNMDYVKLAETSDFSITRTYRDLSPSLLILKDNSQNHSNHEQNPNREHHNPRNQNGRRLPLSASIDTRLPTNRLGHRPLNHPCTHEAEALESLCSKTLI